MNKQCTSFQDEQIEYTRREFGEHLKHFENKFLTLHTLVNQFCRDDMTMDLLPEHERHALQTLNEESLEYYSAICLATMGKEFCFVE